MQLVAHETEALLQLRLLDRCAVHIPDAEYPLEHNIVGIASLQHSASKVSNDLVPLQEPPELCFEARVQRLDINIKYLILVS